MSDQIFLNFGDDEAIWNRRAPTMLTNEVPNGSHRAVGIGGSGRRTRDVIAAIAYVGSGKSGERGKASRRCAAV
ncbi:hypothetical protein A8F31_35205 [Burkholderia cenocepacia]|nr:hypothetical protein A8E31_23955 [Burkholderia cenocepacia]ONY86200.1 hypothetical protein A8F31_35205 [Burkholderia cenocepacia]